MNIIRTSIGLSNIYKGKAFGCALCAAASFWGRAGVEPPSFLYGAQVRCGPFGDADPPQHDAAQGRRCSSPPCQPHPSLLFYAGSPGCYSRYSCDLFPLFSHFRCYSWVNYRLSNNLPFMHVVPARFVWDEPAVFNENFG
jgi:hypothetical protein